MSSAKHDLSNTHPRSAEGQKIPDIRFQDLDPKHNAKPSIESDLGSELQTGPSKFEPPPFQCFLEFINSHSRRHDDSESCYSQTFEPYLENYERSPLQAWALYCARGFTLHLEGQSLAGQLKQGPEALSRDILEQFLGSPSNSSIHYKAWLRLVQNLWDLGKYSQSRAEPGARPDRANTVFANFRAQVQPKSKPCFGCAILGLYGILDLWLSEQKILPDECNARGDSLLHLAVGYSHLETSKILLKSGANPHVRDSLGNTALDLAIRDQNINLIRLLSESEFISEDMVEIAVNGGDAATVEILLDRTTSSSYRGPALQLSEALKYAVQGVRADLVTILLSHLEKDRNIDLQAVIHKGLDYLRSYKTEIDVMKALMKHTKGRIRHCLIHRAVSDDSWAFAEAAVAAGMDVNSTSMLHSGETPLHCLFRERRGDELAKSQKLLDWGAKVDARDRDGNTPLMIGMMTPIVNSKARTTNENQDTEGEESEETSSRLEAFGELLRRGPDINAVNKDGLSVLGIACLYAVVTPPVIQLLLDYGASVNMTQGSGDIRMNPLDILRLHEMPYDESQADFRADRLEAFRMKLKNAGASHLCDDEYEVMSSEEKLKWIRSHRVGVFEVMEDNTPVTAQIPTSEPRGRQGPVAEAMRAEHREAAREGTGQRIGSSSRKSGQPGSDKALLKSFIIDFAELTGIVGTTAAESAQRHSELIFGRLEEKLPLVESYGSETPQSLVCKVASKNLGMRS
ncbi:hypothetical protein IL306_004139 [Fusarium sp. DS 682]|nr:hypothetical protein IL306_004139 [Fusarium sp. DS 682]